MVKRFSEYLADVEEEKGSQQRYAFYHFETEDILARFILACMLNEQRKHVDLGKGREIFFHKAHVPPGQDHLHFSQSGAKLYAVNRDGTAHDASHGKQMARWSIEGMRDTYPDFTVPTGGLIEALMDAPAASLLIESNRLTAPVLVPEQMLHLAERAANASAQFRSPNSI